jgi:hypothetical protein
MSYYILPKINNDIIVNPESSEDLCISYISHSLFNYYSETHNQILNICSCENDISYNKYDGIVKIINPYEYIFSKVPGSKFSVSKLKPKSNIFYDFLEVCTTLNIFDLYKSEKITALHLTEHYNDTIECFEMLRENFDDENFFYNEISDKTKNLIPY